MTPKSIGTENGIGGPSLFRTLVMAISAVAVFACLSIGTITYFLRAEGLRIEQYRLLETLRDENISSLSSLFDERMGAAHVMVTRPDFIAFCKTPDAKDTGRQQKEIHEALETIRKSFRYEAVFLADAQGRIMVTTETISYSPGDFPRREAAVQESINEKRVIMSDVLISKVHKKPAFFFFAPVLDPDTTKVIGVLGILMDPEVQLYPQITHSKYLGETGEILLVNREGLCQSPLKHHEGAIASEVIHAEPARRGAAGEFGIVAIEDYRGEPVMAAYGHIKDFGWGIVVKQDMSEINVPVRTMARNVVSASVVVLIFALIVGLFIARRIAQPALKIAETAVLIGEGNLTIRVPIEGYQEVRQIAMSLNVMVDRLSLQVNVAQGISAIVVASGKHNNTSALLGEILPMFMEATRSQLGVVYLAGATENRLDQVLVHGLNTESVARQLVVSPPDHLLTQNLSSGTIKVLRDIPESNDLRINTQAGKSAPRALLSIPLVQGGTIVGVVGLASLYDYDEAAQMIADGAKTSLAQAVELCRAFENSVRIGNDLDEKNQELTATNEELRAQTEELEQQADELRSLAEDLETQREQVLQADRLKSEFLSNMSHELRTPLNSVLSLSQLMLSNGIGAAGGEDKERLEIIERNGRHLLRLINDLLDLSKIESGRMDLYVSAFPASGPINAAVSAVRPLAKEKDLAVKVDIAEMDDLQSDDGKIRQILLNLLSNAHKFTEKGEIGIAARQEGDSVVFRVWDTGIGIAADHLPRIFDEFMQVDGSTTRKYGGTGLGLAICRRLTAMLGGQINVESEAGKGTTFTVTLPMTLKSQNGKLQQDSTTASKPVRKWRQGGVAPRILVVEDNTVAAEQIVTALKSDGFVVDVATGGEIAKASVLKQVPDGIILDLQMPKVDGFQVLNYIRSTPDTEHLPVLILTAKDLTAKERLVLTNNNVDQLIQKGQLNREELLKSVRRLVGMKNDVVPEATPEASPRPCVTRRKGEKVRILIVEDNPDNMKVTKGILDGMDVEVLEARDGNEALATTKAKRPDIILMDINLPGMSGLEVTHEVKKDKSLRNTVVIALTAKAMMGDREEILAAGCDDYLAKPVEPEELRRTLRKWLEGEAI